MRPFGSPQRDKQPPGDAPPPWLRPPGAGGLAVGIIGRAIGGIIGEGAVALGRVATAFGALSFAGLLVEWLYPRVRTGDE